MEQNENQYHIHLYTPKDLRNLIILLFYLIIHNYLCP